MDGYRHDGLASSAAAALRAAVDGRRPLGTASEWVPAGSPDAPADTPQLLELIDWADDGKPRRAAPWPFLIRRLG